MSGADSKQRSKAAPADAVRWRGSLRTNIALWSGALNVLLLLAVTAAIAWLARDLILDDAKRNTRASAQEAAQRLSVVLSSVTITTTGLSDLVAASTLDHDELTTTLRAMVRATPGANGGLLVLEPVHGSREELGYARYIAADGRDRDLLADGYDYRSKAWYQRTLSSPTGWWSEPYGNETAGGGWRVTYNLPLRPTARGGNARGMVSLDLPLATLTDNFETLAALPGWRVSLVAPAGTLAANPEAGVALNQTLDQYIKTTGRNDLAGAARAVRLHQAEQFDHRDARSGERRYTVVEPVGDSGWSLLVAQSYRLIMARLNEALLLLAAAGTLLALISMLVVRRLAKRISRPVEHLAESTTRLARGQYDQPVPHTGRSDEVGRMARTLEHARTSIQRQLLEIGEMGAARQKLESELSIARDIQLAMLPPARTIERGPMRLEAYAMLEAAKAVGGDFYSFIERDDGELWFAIGDVSDKGVPAALFMARTMTVLEVAARSSSSPEQVLAEASRRLVEGNDTCMFATVLCGRIDLHDGQCTLASAGHESPLLLPADGPVQTIDFETGPPLGFEVSSRFPMWRGKLEPGASLIAYTDGITEAFNADDQAYGSDRLLAALRTGYSAQDNCRRLIAEVHRFAGAAPQSDDITVLAIRLSRQTETPETGLATMPETKQSTEERAHADTSDRPG
jgi:sigma-B regulation protein RsbU (phosphoserine phosphatase)